MEQSTKNPTGMVLLVDDDPGLIEGFRFALEDVGHNVVTAMDAEEARTQCARCDFAVCEKQSGLVHHRHPPPLSAFRIVVVTSINTHSRPGYARQNLAHASAQLMART